MEYIIVKKYPWHKWMKKKADDMILQTWIIEYMKIF